MRHSSSRNVTYPLFLIALAALAGCQSKPPRFTDPAQTQRLEQFKADFQTVLQHNLGIANQQGLIGAVKLKVTLNTEGQPTHCEAVPVNFKYADRLKAPYQSVSSSRAVMALVEHECWNMLYPKVPTELFSDKGEVKLVAPLALMPASPLAAEHRTAGLTRNAQREFFSQQVVGKVPTDSIGVASFRFKAGSRGDVEGCLVNLYPAPARPDAFKLDTGLQERLGAECKALDLRKMPGFVLDEEGVAQGYVTVEYTPWKAARKQGSNRSPILDTECPAKRADGQCMAAENEH